MGAVVLLGALHVLAAAPPSMLGNVDSANPSSAGVGSVNADALVGAIMRLVNWFAWFIGVASVAIGLYAGFLFITARGEPAQIKTARGTLVWVVVGVAVAMVAFSIIILTKTFLNL